VKHTEEQLRALFEQQATQLGFNINLGPRGYSSTRTEHLWLGFQLGAAASAEKPVSQDSKRSKDG
jgi:hypothetical protein